MNALASFALGVGCALILSGLARRSQRRFATKSAQLKRDLEALAEPVEPLRIEYLHPGWAVVDEHAGEAWDYALHKSARIKLLELQRYYAANPPRGAQPPSAVG